MGSGPSLALTVCPITGVPYIDPVIAADGHTYSRKAILEWQQFWKETMEQSTACSPLTGQALPDNLRLRADNDAQLALDEAGRSYDRASKAKPAYLSCRESDTRTLGGQISSIHELNHVFAILDPHSDLLSDVTAVWKPPRLVVLGEEGSGKSTLFERLLMMPIFPHLECRKPSKNNPVGAGIRTQAVLEVRLRHTREPSTLRLQVVDSDSQEIVRGPYLIAAESGGLDVMAQMRQLVIEEQSVVRAAISEKANKDVQNPGNENDDEQVLVEICSLRKIVVEVNGPHLPNLDLVDMPGVVQQPKQVAAATRALVDSQVCQHSEDAFFLAAVPAGRTFATSAAMNVIEAFDLHPRTIGVFTKCDEVPSHLRSRLDSARKTKGNKDAQQREGELPPEAKLHSCVGVSNQKAEISLDAKQMLSHGNLLRLQEQAKSEVQFFENERMTDLVEQSLAGTKALQKQITSMYTRYLLQTWAPQITWRLKREYARLLFEMALLGPPTPASREEFGSVRPSVAAAARKMLEKEKGEIACTIVQEALGPLEHFVRQRLGSEVVTSVDDHSSQWQQLEDTINGSCDSAIQQASQCISAWIRSTLENQQSPPAWPSVAAEELVGKTLYQPSRYPKYISAVVARANHLMSPWQSQLKRSVQECVRKIFDVSSPFVKIKSRLAACPPQARAHFDVNGVIGVLMSALARNDLCGKKLCERLLDALPSVALEVQEWLDLRSSERASLQRRLSNIENTRKELLQVLGKSPPGLVALDKISLAHCSCQGVGIHYGWHNLLTQFTITVRDHNGALLSIPEGHSFEATIRERSYRSIKLPVEILRAEAVDIRSDDTMQWMWGDAGTSLFGHDAAQNDPMRWSAWHSLSRTITDLAKIDTVSRPVEIRTKRAMTVQYFDTLEKALLVLRTQEHQTDATEPVPSAVTGLVVSYTVPKEATSANAASNDKQVAMELCVKFHGLHVHGSPFSVLVSAEPLWPSVKMLDQGGDLRAPAGVAVYGGLVYVADSQNHCIQVFKSTGNFVRSVGSDNGISEQSAPWGIAVDEDCIYVVETKNNTVKVIGKSDGVVLQQFGSPGLGEGQLLHPYGLCLDGDRIYVADSSNHRIQVWKRERGGIFEPDGSIGAVNQLKKPTGLHIDGDHIHVADKDAHRIYVFSKLDGRLRFAYGSRGNEDGQVESPEAVVIDGPYAYVSDEGNHRIQVFDKCDGRFIKSIGSRGRGEGLLREPCCMFFHNKQLYVSEKGNCRVQVFKADAI